MTFAFTWLSNVCALLALGDLEAIPGVAGKVIGNKQTIC